MVLLFAGGCAQTGTGGAEHAVGFSRPAKAAAACLAQNAEAHSSALVAQVSPASSGAFDVVVRVKNGVTYAEARIEPRAAGAAGRLTLYVTSSRGNRELIDRLVKGC